MEEMNLSIQKDINTMQKKEKILKLFNIILLVVISAIACIILLHKLYLKENTYSILKNDIVTSVETVTIDSKDTEINDNGELQYYIIFSNDKIRNRIYVNKGVYNKCNIGDETVLNIKDIYDKKGNILKEELLFDIIE